MPSCCFCGRWQIAKVKNEGLTFHKFPKDNPTLTVWMDFAKQCLSEVKPRSVVCSAHFTEDCFDRFLRSVRLKKLAIPTIMIQRVKNAKTLYPEVLMPLDEHNKTNVLDNDQYKNDDLKLILPQSSTEQYVKVTETLTNMEGVESIIFENLDNSISTKDDHCDTFVLKKPDKIKIRIKNQKINSICQPAINDSPRPLILKRKINNYIYQMNFKNKRIKYLNQKVQRQKKTISSLKNIIATLKDNNLLHQDNADLLSDCFGKNNYLIASLAKQNLGKKLPCKYPAELRHTHVTARLFRSSYRKLIIHATIRDDRLGNCIPQEQIGILNTSSVIMKEPTDYINETCLLRNIDVELDTEQFHLKDHDYIANTNSLSSFSEEAIIYKAGFVAHQLKSKIKCDICVNALFGEKTNYLKSLINLRDKGGLSYPSSDVIKICIQTEKNIRIYQFDHKPISKMLVVNKTLNFFVSNSKVFESIQLHNFDYEPVTNHVILLLKSIICSYCDLQINYLCKKMSEADSLRNWYNKIILFKGQ